MPLSVGIVLLAAGGSSRMGRPKQLLAVGDRPLVRRVVEAAAKSPCRPIVVVLGAHAEAIKSELAGLPASIVINHDWRKGIGGSIRTGVQALIDQADVEALVLLLADQPMVDEKIVARLLQSAAGCGAEIVASAYMDTIGPPTLFRRGMFPKLLALDDAEGGKRVIQQAGTAVEKVPFPAGQVDLDTPHDYATLEFPNRPDWNGGE